MKVGDLLKPQKHFSPYDTPLPVYQSAPNPQDWNVPFATVVKQERDRFHSLEAPKLSVHTFVTAPLVVRVDGWLAGALGLHNRHHRKVVIVPTKLEGSFLPTCGMVWYETWVRHGCSTYFSDTTWHKKKYIGLVGVKMLETGTSYVRSGIKEMFEREQKSANHRGILLGWGMAQRRSTTLNMMYREAAGFSILAEYLNPFHLSWLKTQSLLLKYRDNSNVFHYLGRTSIWKGLSRVWNADDQS